MELTRGKVIAFALFVACWNVVFWVVDSDSEMMQTTKRAYAGAVGPVDTVEATVIGYDPENKWHIRRTMGEDATEIVVEYEVDGRLWKTTVYPQLSHPINGESEKLEKGERFSHEIEYVRGQPSISRLKGGRWGPESPMLVYWILFSYAAAVAFFVWLYRSVGAEDE